MNFTPYPGDLFLYVDEGKGFTSTISRWAIGRYNHISMYLGEAFGVPFLYESAGRGVSIVNVQHQVGRLVTVLRWKESGQWPVIPHRVIDEAIKIASDPKSYYDYLCYVTSCLPRVLKEKFPFLPIPSQYHRDPTMICSEAVARAWWNAGIRCLKLPYDSEFYIVIQLPRDFVDSNVFDAVYEGRLFEDIFGGDDADRGT